MQVKLRVPKYLIRSVARPDIQGSTSDRDRDIFFSCKASRIALGATLPPTQWTQPKIPPAASSRGMNTVLLQPVPLLLIHLYLHCSRDSAVGVDYGWEGQDISLLLNVHNKSEAYLISTWGSLPG
jgi:hypothetical protein